MAGVLQDMSDLPMAFLELIDSKQVEKISRPSDGRSASWIGEVLCQTCVVPHQKTNSMACQWVST